MNLLKRYIWWTERRGSLHYDVMVTAILLFLFVSPRFINFGDRPAEVAATHASEVLVREAGSVGNHSRFLYQIRVEDMHHATTDEERRMAILRAVEPISGEVSLERYEPLLDHQGRVIAYNAWVLR